MTDSLADFSVVKKELDNLDSLILQQNVRLRELQSQEQDCKDAEAALWSHYASQACAIGNTECCIADQIAVLAVYNGVLASTEEADKVAEVPGSGAADGECISGGALSKVCQPSGEEDG